MNILHFSACLKCVFFFKNGKKYPQQSMTSQSVVYNMEIYFLKKKKTHYNKNFFFFFKYKTISRRRMHFQLITSFYKFSESGMNFKNLRLDLYSILCILLVTSCFRVHISLHSWTDRNSKQISKVFISSTYEQDQNIYGTKCQSFVLVREYSDKPDKKNSFIF